MKEQDYINVSDLSCVSHAKAILCHVTIENQPNIDPQEFRDVMRKISEWEAKLLVTCNLGDDDVQNGERPRSGK